MSLVDRLTAGGKDAVHGTPCSVGVLLATLPESEAAALQTMLDTGWTARQIWDACQTEGLAGPAYQSINRHRRLRCRCVKDGSHELC